MLHAETALGPTLQYFFNTYSKSNKFEILPKTTQNEDLIAKFLAKIKNRVDKGFSAPCEDMGVYVDPKPVELTIIE